MNVEMMLCDEASNLLLPLPLPHGHTTCSPLISHPIPPFFYINPTPLLPNNSTPKMASSSSSFLLRCLLTLSILQTTLSTTTCSPYTTCNTMPTFKSSLHYTYTPSNSTLSVAFTATPPSPTGWVGWGINPTATGMAGTQAFVAFKSPSDGSVSVSTFNLSSYSEIIPGKLSFPVYDKRAEFNAGDGSFTIYAVVKSDGGKINYVWQVGHGVTKGFPQKHDFKPENLMSKTSIDLSSTPKADSGKSTSTSSGCRKSNVGSLAILVLSVLGFLIWI